MKGTTLVIASLLSASVAYATPVGNKPLIAKQPSPVVLNDKQMDTIVAGEDISLSFGQIVIEYRPQKPDGSLSPQFAPPPNPSDQPFGQGLSQYIHTLQSGGGCGLVLCTVGP
jgi:hypothetical protein